METKTVKMVQMKLNAFNVKVISYGFSSQNNVTETLIVLMDQTKAAALSA